MQGRTIHFMNKEHNLLDEIKVIFAACSWGTMGVFVRLIDMPTSLIACYRGFIGAIFLYVLGVIAYKKYKLDFKAIRENIGVLILSGIALGINWILLFESYRKTTLALSTLCYYMAPVIVIIASILFFKESFNFKKLFCVLISLVGMLLISGVLDSSQRLASKDSLGMLLALLAACFYATVTILGRKTKNISSNEETIVKLFVAAAILIPYNVLTVDSSSIKATPFMILMLIILGIVHTGGAFFAYFSAIHGLESQKVALLTYLDPVVAVFISKFILKEEISLLAMVGAMLLIGSLVAYEFINHNKMDIPSQV